MNTKNIVATAVFAALTIVLNPAISGIGIPAPYAPFLIYGLWEIPIVTAAFLYGLKRGISIAALNTVVLLALFPGALPTGPFYNLAAVLSMLLGIFIVKKIPFLNKTEDSFDVRTTALFTIFGMTSRAAIMAAINYTFLRFPPPIGFAFPEEVIMATIPLTVLFNATLSLYTIPLGRLVSKLIRSNAKR
ncbi:MAG: hypothetical protein RMK50_01435 [Nitrososphaerota archaeon]|nr:hypothetical protein [Candidatus Bathyarchaeota archaeon]MDW8193478.1 hypothetical protein [Nitrososphaerota archaeon]